MIEELAIEAPRPALFRVRSRRKRELHRQHLLGIEARFNGLKTEETPGEKPRSGGQHEGKSKLGNDESTPEAMSDASGSHPVSTGFTVAFVTRCLQSGSEPEEQSGNDGHSRSKEEHREVHSDRVDSWKVGWIHSLERARRDHGE